MNDPKFITEPVITLLDDDEATKILEQLIQHTLLYGVDTVSKVWAQVLSDHIENAVPKEQEPVTDKPTDKERITDEDYRQRATDLYGHVDGLEIDVESTVSRTDDEDDDTGAYVQAWLWVENDEDEDDDVFWETLLEDDEVTE